MSLPIRWGGGGSCRHDGFLAASYRTDPFVVSWDVGVADELLHESSCAYLDSGGTKAPTRWVKVVVSYCSSHFVQH